MKKTTNQILSKSFLKAALLKNVLLTLIATIVLLSSYAGSISSTGAGGNWNATATWVGGIVPLAGDDVTIVNGATVTVTAAAACSSITIDGTLKLNAGLTINGAWALNAGATFTPNSQTVTFGTGGSIGGTAVTTFRNLTISTTNATDVVTLLTSGANIQNASGGGILTLDKGIFNIGTGNTLNMIGGGGGNTINNPNATGTSNLATTGTNGSDGGTINFTSGNAVTVNGPGQTTFFNLTSSSNPSFTITSANTVLINGTVNIRTNSTGLHFAGSNSPIYGPASTLYIDHANGGYALGLEWLQLTSGTIGVTPGYPNNVTLTNIGTSAGGFNNGNGWVPNVGLAINGILTLGDNTTNAQVDFSNVPGFTCGGFVLNTNSRFIAPKGTMTVNGNWADNQAVSGNTKGFFINGTSTVVFAGTGSCSSPNTIAGPGANVETFNNLTIAANVNLLSPVTLNATGIFTLTSGILTTTPVNILTVNNSVVTAITGGSGSSYINGPVNWNLSAAAGTYNFPIGAGTCTATYLPFTLNKIAGNSVNATAQAFNTGSGGTTDGSLSSLSTTEYWSVSTSSSLAGSTISVARPTTISPLAYIAESSVSNGVYTSIGGTAVANGVNNSNAIGAGSLFFTLGVPPIVSTLPATSITTTGATLNGSFNTQGSSLPTSFTYGTNTSSGLGTPVTIHSPINSTSSTPDSAIITGLTANTLYTFKATDGVNSGNDVTFITAPNPPAVGIPSNPTGSGFIANWSAPAVPGTATYTYTIQVSSDSTFATGVTTQSGIPSANTSFTFTNLSSATTYYYRVEAVNATANSVWSSTSIGIITDLVPTPPCNNNTSNDGATTFTNAAPVIDGTIDSVWTNAPSNPINVVTLGNNNNTQNWKSLWTADSLYLLVQVTDASLVGQGSGLQGSVAVPGVQQGTSVNYYEADGIEFYLDPDHSNGGNYDGVNDVQLRFNLGSNTISGQSAGGTAQFAGAAFQRDAPLIDWKMVVTPTGYLLEAAIPWGKDALNPGVFLLPNNTYGTPTNGQTVGIDVNVNDQDVVGAGRQAQIQWFNNSTDAYLHPNVFSNAGLQVCPEPPVVVNPTKVNITSTSADLGATVVSSGKDAQLNISPLTSRGTAYSTTLPVTSNAAAEGNTQLGIYSSVRTGLSPQTKYYYLGYANNANNQTGVSSVDSFYTLSEIPTVQPTVTSTSCSQLTLNWTSITFPPVAQASQTGYIILRRQDGTDPTTTGISTRVAVTQSALPTGTTLVATVNSGATLTYTDATAVAGITYNYLLVPFTWDGVVADSTFNYFITSAPTTSASLGSGLAAPTVQAAQPTCTIPTGSITVTAPTSGVTYSFDSGVTFQNNATSGSLIPGSYQVVVKSTAGCLSTATPVTIDAAPLVPVAPAVNPTQPTCTTATGSITVTAPASGVTYSFDNGATFQSSATSGNLAAGTYQVIVKSTGGCVSPATAVTINSQPSLPVVTATADQTTVSPGATVTLTGTSSIQGTYLWTSSPLADLTTPADLTTQTHPAQTTDYTLTVTTADNCQGSKTVTVIVQNIPCPLNPPKAFTPNKDGYNDVWMIFRGDCVQKTVVNVYNRWGNQVYHSDDYQNDWDGSYKGSPLPDGTYYYVILSTQNNRTYTLTGNITILR